MTTYPWEAPRRITVGEKFKGLFSQPSYDGSYHGADGFRTAASEEAADSFYMLSETAIQWCQVHGDFKNAAKRAIFTPYPYWTELYDSCQRVLRAHADLRTEFHGPLTCARLMGDAMVVLRERYQQNVPRFWLPIMNKLRSKD